MNTLVLKTSVTVSLVLKEPNIHLDTRTERNKTIIVFRVTAGRGIGARFSTGYKINPKYWDKDRQRVRNVASVTNAVMININLEELKIKFNKLVSEFVTQGKAISKETIKDIYDTISNKSLITPVNETEMTFFKFCDEFIANKEKKLPKTRGNKSQTVGAYEQAIRHFKEFQDEAGFEVDFDTIDMEFYEEFNAYMQDKLKTDGNHYSINTIGKHIKTLCTILNEATAKGHNKSLAYKSSDFKIKHELTTAIYLNLDELQSMLNYDLSKYPKHEKARDVFIMGTETGQRVSDFNRFSESQRISDSGTNEEYFVINQKKTSNKVHCFVTPVMKHIMETRYNGNPPTKMIEQHINILIKEVGQMVGIDNTVVFERTEGGVRVSREIPKYSLIATHTARRSYATNKFKAGVLVQDIMHLTGHKTEREFLKYIREDGKSQTMRIINTKEFRTSNLKVV